MGCDLALLGAEDRAPPRILAWQNSTCSQMMTTRCDGRHSYVKGVRHQQRAACHTANGAVMATRRGITVGVSACSRGPRGPSDNSGLKYLVSKTTSC